jgi:protein SCO1/2
VVAVAGVLGLWLARRPSPPPVLGTVPTFALIERSGLPLTSADLTGHVWVADFIFTRCPDFCPALTTRMAEHQKTLTTGDDPVRLVSFSVDPENDRPDVLRTYAARTNASGHWSFVTGDRAALVALLRDGFKVAWADGGPPTSPITHSDRFVLVDRQLRIRGYYHGTDVADVQRLARDADALRRDPRS